MELERTESAWTWIGFGTWDVWFSNPKITRLTSWVLWHFWSTTQADPERRLYASSSHRLTWRRPQAMGNRFCSQIYCQTWAMPGALKAYSSWRIDEVRESSLQTTITKTCPKTHLLGKTLAARNYEGWTNGWDMGHWIRLSGFYSSPYYGWLEARENPLQSRSANDTCSAAPTCSSIHAGQTWHTQILQ
mgnify:CR=1 FL=1